MEPDAFGKVFEQVPQLAGLVWVVYKFLGHQDLAAQRNAVMFDRITEAVEATKEALGKNSAILERAIRHLEGK